ncbi:MAG: hypothetical protein RJA02_1923, partial [Armatimonadota bacterium]
MPGMRSSMVMMAVSALPFGLGMMVPVNAEQLPTNNARKVLGSTCVSCHGKTNPAGNIDLSSDSGIQ